MAGKTVKNNANTANIQGITELPEITVTKSQPTHDFKSCVQAVRYFSDLILGTSGASKNLYNIRGNAWNLADSAYGKVFTPQNNTKYKIGDIVIFDRPKLATDTQRGIPEKHQHAGIISGFDANGEPMISHFLPSKNADNTYQKKSFIYTPISKVSLGKYRYTPSQVIRLNVASDTFEGEFSKMPLNDKYGLQLKGAIDALNSVDFTKRYNLTEKEDNALKIGTAAILGLESSFGGGERFAVRHTFPNLVNTIKEMRRDQPSVASIGYGSIKPQLVYQNTNYPDLDEALKAGNLSKKEYYQQTSNRTQDFFSKTAKLPLAANLLYTTNFENKYHPISNPSYTQSLLSWSGLDTRRLGDNIETDARLIFSQLAGLHKKYPNKSIKELVQLYRGSSFNAIDSANFDSLTQQLQTGEVDQPVKEKIIQLYSKGIDTLRQLKQAAKNKVYSNLPVGVNIKAALTDFSKDSQLITEDFLSSAEYSALKDVVGKAVKNNKHLLGYSNSDNYQAYSDLGESVSGGQGNQLMSVVSNLTDPYTKLQNFLGQAAITEDTDNYYVIDTYDFNNNKQLLSPLQGFVKNPTPYGLVRALGTTQGSAPGVGRNIKIKIPKTEIKFSGGKINYLEFFRK